MGRNYEPLFKVIPQEPLPAYLCERICEAILRERERRFQLWERSQLVISSLTGISSLAGLMFALPALMNAADSTGFSTFASLFISDSDVMMSHFSTFGLSLLEALPGFEITVTLLLLAVFLVSLRNFFTSLFNVRVAGQYHGHV